MALNITFTCNNVVDENDNAINCKYQVYYPEHNHWNDARDTELFQYNCNAGDGDALTQTGALLSGQHIVIALWQGDGAGGTTGADRTGLKDRFAYHVITHDGVTNTYVIDVKLTPKEAPTCNWYLPSTATINREVTAASYASDNFTYAYSGTTHYHYRKYGSELIFNSVGNLTVTFNFEDGDGYEATNKHTFTTVADYNAKHKVVNGYSLESICNKDIRLKYNVPIGFISFNPDGYGAGDEVSKGSFVDVNAAITDEDSRITSIDYNWTIKNRTNNATIVRDTLVNANTNLTYTYNVELLELQDSFAYQRISWNDGWQDLLVTKSKELQVKNIAPDVAIGKIDLSAKEKRFTQISEDADGTVTSWKWKIFLLMPFSGAWVEVFNTATDGSPIEILFNEAGRYKAEITVEDDWKKYSTTNSSYAGFSSDEIEFDISAAGNCTAAAGMTDEVFFIFPDVIGDGIE